MSKSSSYYATTPLYYVNAEPHLGHAYNNTLVDVVTRFHRLKGDDTFFLTGTDEHGEKVHQAATAKGMLPQDYTTKISNMFRSTWDDMDIAYDDFIRTTEERHTKVVQEMLQYVYDQGDIYYGEYSGLYCVGAERFVTEKELVDGKCPDSNQEPEYRSEVNYFLNLEKYRPWLQEYLEAHPDLIRPKGYRNEVLAMLREPLGDLSISRPKSRVSWGIPLPWDADHVTYVWFDALFNYYSVLKHHGTTEKYWSIAEHFIGKDIVKTHAIFWPIMLKAAGLPVYKHLNVHGHWLVEGIKMSKSIGNVVKPLDLQKKYGNDAFRYFLLRDMTFGLDASFSEIALAERINSDLANDLGNLLNRTLGMLNKYQAGIVKKPAEYNTAAEDKELIDAFLVLPQTMSDEFDALRYDRAVEAVLEAVRRANKYIAETTPWTLAKDPAQADRLAAVLYNCVEALRCAAILLSPIMPAKTVELHQQLGLGKEAMDFVQASTWGNTPDNTQTRAGEPLFPRIDMEALHKARAELQENNQATITTEETNTMEETTNQPTTEQSTTNNETASEEVTGIVHKEEVSIDDFGKLEFRVAEVLSVEEHPKADRLLVLHVALGEEKRTIVSGIKQWYTPDEMVGKKVIIVANLKPVKLRGVLSQGMILAAKDDQDDLTVCTVDRDIVSGSEVA